MIVRYRDNGFLTEAQKNFNRIQSSTRAIVEHSIGLLKGRWRILLDRMDVHRTDLIPYYIIVCCILHNLCLKNNENLEYPGLIPEPSNYLGPHEPTRYQCEMGRIKRDRIKDNLPLRNL